MLIFDSQINNLNRNSMKEADETIYEGNVEDINNTTQSEEESVNVEGKIRSPLGIGNMLW